MAARTTIGTIADERIDAYGRLVEAQRRLNRAFDRSLRDAVGISIVWYDALLRLGRSAADHVPISELGDALDLSSGGATRLVDRLVDRGYVERADCPTDRRVAWIGLTPEGRRVLTEATDVHLRDLELHFASRLTTTQAESLKTILQCLRDEDHVCG